MPEQVVLYIFFALVIGGAFMSAFLNQILYAIIGLGIALLGLAGIFLYLGSPFVAAMQVLIYIGGITVAMVFAMMLSIAMSIRAPKPGAAKFAFAIFCTVIFFGGVARIIMGSEFTLTPQAPASAWQVEQLGHALLTTYNLVFEALSVVLLLAIIGAILIAKKEKTT